MGWDTPDAVMVGTRSRNGAEGTYNHLTDAILDVAATRAMYMRRLRTLADRYLAGGRIRQVRGGWRPGYRGLGFEGKRGGGLQRGGSGRGDEEGEAGGTEGRGLKESWWGGGVPSGGRIRQGR